MTNLFSAEFLDKVTTTLNEKTEGGKSITRKDLAVALDLEVSEKDGKADPMSPGLRVVDALVATGALAGFVGSRGRGGGLTRVSDRGLIAEKRAMAASASIDKEKEKLKKQLAKLNVTVAGLTDEPEDTEDFGVELDEAAEG